MYFFSSHQDSLPICSYYQIKHPQSLMVVFCFVSLSFISFIRHWNSFNTMCFIQLISIQISWLIISAKMIWCLLCTKCLCIQVPTDRQPFDQICQIFHFCINLLLQLMTKGALRIHLVYLTDNVSCNNIATIWTNFNNKHLPNSN